MNDQNNNGDTRAENSVDNLEGIIGDINKTLATLTMPDLPNIVHAYGECIELVKRGVAQCTEMRTLLAEALDAYKGDIVDNVRGGKASLSEKDKSELRLHLAGDALYQKALSADYDARRTLTLWDARRSRLNRDYEVARIDYQTSMQMEASRINSNYLDGVRLAAQRSGEKLLEDLRTKLFNFADYAANKLRNTL